MLWSHWHRHTTNSLLKKHFNREKEPNFDEVDHCQGLCQLNCWPSELYGISEVLLINLLMGWVLNFFSFAAIIRKLYIFGFSHDIVTLLLQWLPLCTLFKNCYNLKVTVWEKETKGLKRKISRRKEKPRKYSSLIFMRTLHRENNFLVCILVIVVLPIVFPF